MIALDLEIRAAITRAAADWYAAHRMGPLSEAERAAFLEWLKASPLHMEEYLGVAALEKTLAAATHAPSMSVQAWVDLARDDPGTDVLSFSGAGLRRDEHRGGPPRRSWLGWAAAACVSSGLGLAWVWHGGNDRGAHDPAGTGLVKTFRTGHGEQGTWKLPDGSTLHVNTDSAATLRFSRAERLLEVDHGQVAVEVAHDERRPFRVHAGAADAVAVGTNFDVYRLADSVEITVVNGQVAVSLDGLQVSGPASLPPAGIVRVSGGQQIRIAGGVLPAAATPADLRETTAWLERKIVFEQRPLAAVAQEFNRYNDSRFTIEDRTLRDLPISGTFAAADTASFAAFLQSLGGVRVERVASGYRILRSR